MTLITFGFSILFLLLLLEGCFFQEVATFGSQNAYRTWAVRSDNNHENINTFYLEEVISCYCFWKKYSKEYCLITVWVSTHKRKTFWNKEKVMYLSELHKETSKFVMTVKKCILDQVGKACCNYNFRDF